VAILFEPIDDLDRGCVAGESIEQRRINRNPDVEVTDRFVRRFPRRLYYRDDRQIELPRKFEIAGIMPRDAHDCARAVTHQDIIRDPDRDAFIVRWINRKRAGENTGLFFG
jgi:hypothetical protein